MNRKIAISSMSILGALVIMGGATFAAFSDSATATGNTFATGNADLLIAADNEGSPSAYLNSIPGASFSGLFPGFDERFLFWLNNDSDSDISLNLTADLLNLSPEVSDLDDNLMISWACDTSGNGGLEPEEKGPEFSVRAWVDGGAASIGTLTQGDEMICAMYSRVPTTANNDIAGETISFDVTYDGTQVMVP